MLNNQIKTLLYQQEYKSISACRMIQDLVAAGGASPCVRNANPLLLTDMPTKKIATM